MIHFGLALVFFVSAFLYSLGGFAGGSSYVLALTLTGVPLAQIPATSLLCNILVSSIGFVNFRNAGHFKARLALPFVLGSAPAAYLAARIHVPKDIFIILLSVSLIAASLRDFFFAL